MKCDSREAPTPGPWHMSNITPSLPWQTFPLPKARELKLECEWLLPAAQLPGGSPFPCPSAALPHSQQRAQPGSWANPAAGALSSIFLSRKLDFLKNFPSCFL